MLLIPVNQHVLAFVKNNQGKVFNIEVSFMMKFLQDKKTAEKHNSKKLSGNEKRILEWSLRTAIFAAG